MTRSGYAANCSARSLRMTALRAKVLRPLRAHLRELSRKGRGSLRSGRVKHLRIHSITMPAASGDDFLNRGAIFDEAHRSSKRLHFHFLRIEAELMQDCRVQVAVVMG